MAAVWWRPKMDLDPSSAKVTQGCGFIFLSQILDTKSYQCPILKLKSAEDFSHVAIDLSGYVALSSVSAACACGLFEACGRERR
jgi:hypothetical protein